MDNFFFFISYTVDLIMSSVIASVYYTKQWKPACAIDSPSVLVKGLYKSNSMGTSRGLLGCNTA